MKERVSLTTQDSNLNHHSSATWRLLRAIASLLLVAFLNLSVGCNYYLVRTHHKEGGEITPRIEALEKQNKVFILHFKDDIWLIKNIAINADKSEMRGELGQLPSELRNYHTTDTTRVKRYKANERGILKEVHIYVSEYAVTEGSAVIIPFSAIERIEVYDRAQAATTASWVFGSLGVAMGVMAVVVIIILMSKSSCPFIYIHNGEHFVFTGEVFSGAIQPGLERHDYLLLPDIAPNEGEYLIRVANEIREIQHINQMQLLVIDHSEDISVLVDKHGKLQTIRKARQPVDARTYSGTLVTSLVAGKDSLSYYFDDAITTDATLDGIILTFDKPADASAGKLIIRAKNSFWIETVMHQFHGLFGRRYDAFSQRDAKRNPDEMRQIMIQQNFPLAVYIEKGGIWEPVDFFEVAGPMAMKDDVLEINLENIPQDTFRIKLESGFLFWELDYVAMDFSENMLLPISIIPVSEAIDELGNDISDAIRSDDHVYYIQPEIGNEAVLRFSAPAFSDSRRTVILHSKGFYTILRDQDGRADWNTIRTFRQPGRMPQFSKELYHKMMQVSQQN